MNRAAFWGLVERVRADAGDDTERQSELLEERLSELPPPQIVRFHQIRRQMDEQAFTWDIWGAAYVIEDGCSDDCFRDFRAYLISLGPTAFAAALRDPDSLAPIVQDAEKGDWENADDVTPDAYESATGDDFGRLLGPRRPPSRRALGRRVTGCARAALPRARGTLPLIAIAGCRLSPVSGPARRRRRRRTAIPSRWPCRSRGALGSNCRRTSRCRPR